MSYHYTSWKNGWCAGIPRQRMHFSLIEPSDGNVPTSPQHSYVLKYAKSTQKNVWTEPKKSHASTENISKIWPYWFKSFRV